MDVRLRLLLSLSLSWNLLPNSAAFLCCPNGPRNNPFFSSRSLSQTLAFLLLSACSPGVRSRSQFFVQYASPPHLGASPRPCRRFFLLRSTATTYHSLSPYPLVQSLAPFEAPVSSLTRGQRAVSRPSLYLFHLSFPFPICFGCSLMM